MIRLIWKMFELIKAMSESSRFKEGIDAMLDPIEDIFSEDKDVQRACRRIRKLLDVPDNDDDEDS